MNLDNQKNMKPAITSPKYRNIIFDLGGVLIYFNPREIIQKIFEGMAVIPWEILEMVKTPEWLELDRGTLTPDELADVLSSKVSKQHMQMFLAAVFRSLKPLENGLEILHAVQQKGYNTYILSNMTEYAYNKISEYDFLKTFSGAVYSYRIKAVKPENVIYKHLLDTYNLKPEECLFIDDLEININAGKQLGIDGIVCSNHHHVLQELKRRGIL